MTKELNLTNPNDPQTKLFLENLNILIAKEVLLLTEMYKHLYGITISKQQEEKEMEFTLGIEKIELEDKRRKELDKLNELLSANMYEKYKGNEERLLALRTELQTLSQNLILTIHHLENQVAQCDRDIAQSKEALVEHSVNLEMIEALIIAAVIDKLLERGGARSAKGERVKVDLSQVEVRPLKDLHDSTSSKETLPPSNEEGVEKLKNHREELILNQVLIHIAHQTQPDQPVTPEDIINLRRANPELVNEYKQIRNKHDPAVTKEMSGFLSAAQTINEKTQEKEACTNEIQTKKQQLTEVEEKINGVDNDLENVNSKKTRQPTPRQPTHPPE